MDKSVLTRISSALNRRDEVPNLKLAKEIVSKKNAAAVKELVENLSNKSKAIQQDCIKVLYEIGELSPAMIAPYSKEFIAQLDSKNNRMQWGAMTAINTITLEKPKEIFEALPKLLTVADAGSVITNDNVFNILVKLGALKQYANKVSPIINERLLKSTVNQLPMYAEKLIDIVTSDNRNLFLKTLTRRLGDIDKESKQKRVEKVIKKISTMKS